MSNAENIKIGHNLRRFREVMHLSQRDLAKKSGISNSTISRIEDGKQAEFNSLKALAQTLNISLDDLVYTGPNYVTCEACGGLGAVPAKGKV